MEFGSGFHAEDLGEDIPFRWMSLRGEVSFAPLGVERFLELEIRSHFYDLSQNVRIGATGLPLVHGWNPVSVSVPVGATAASLAANKLFPPEHYPGDGRELAVQVRSLRLHEDPVRHAHVTRQHANSVANVRELLSGATRLASTPMKLGIDMQGACNVKPPCVYCAWDYSKKLEGANVDVPFTPETLDAWGPFFDNVAELVNCSIGEPFMGKDIDALLDVFGDRGKLLEVTINGQILTDVNIRKLLGRNIHVFISCDAATPATYARLRNDQFPRLVENIRRLIQAKGGPGKLPLVYLVFMPMRANVHEVDAFVRLCADVKPDRLVLRPLNDGAGLELKFDRAGYHFDYQKELLPFGELVRISGRVAELCRRLGVPLSDQMDFGGRMEEQFAETFARGRREADGVLGPEPPPAARASAPPADTVQKPRASLGTPPSLGEERLPACTEPWNSLYVLRRGVLPCCYGASAIAPMSDFQAAWNGPLLQDIRKELHRGSFHRYCLDSQDCPIVRKSAEAGSLAPSAAFVIYGRRLLVRLERAGIGWPRRAWRALKPYWPGGGNNAARST